MGHLGLGLVLHNHQPVGNYGFVIEDVYRASYAPMIEALERHPGVRIAMHHSGPLLDWLESNHPDYVDRLATLCEHGQVEPLSGGYYEPILPMIHDADKVGQVRKLSAYVERRLGQRPRGAWLAERVWEPGLPTSLAAAGIEWTLVDDAHFQMAGLSAGALDGYFITEDQGRRVKLFAGSQRLRYAIPWMNVDELMAELRTRAEASPERMPYLVLGDDGEKFGAWPTTYAHVWEEGWIEEFFAALEAASSWLDVMPPGEYAAAHEARGLVYLPAASYAEMMEWALPADASAAYGRALHALEHDERHDVLPFMRGGFWRYFIAKYPEINAMHKRGERIARALGKRESEAASAARDALWAAQCNCPYWHGVFGGLYLRNIRAVTLANLVRAERLAKARPGLTIDVADHDYDGADDVLVQTPSLSLLVQPERGGAVTEFDLRERDHALLGVVARWREPYHQALLSGEVSAVDEAAATNIHGGVRVKEAGLLDALAFDLHRRAGAQDWIIGEDVTVEAFAARSFGPQWTPDGAWQCTARRSRTGATVKLMREHGGWCIEKTIMVPASGEQCEVRYVCTNTNKEHRRARLISEWNISLPHAADGDDRIATLMAGGGKALDLTSVAGLIADPRALTLSGSAGHALTCTVDGDGCDVWHYPVESISSSEGGLERVFQGVAIGIAQWLDLAPGRSASFSYSWSVVEPG